MCGIVDRSGDINNYDNELKSIRISADGLYFDKDKVPLALSDKRDLMRKKIIEAFSASEKVKVICETVKVVVIPSELYDQSLTCDYFSASSIEITEEDTIMSDIMENMTVIYTIDKKITDTINVALGTRSVYVHIITDILKVSGNITADNVVLYYSKNLVFIVFCASGALIYADAVYVMDDDIISGHLKVLFGSYGKDPAIYCMGNNTEIHSINMKKYFSSVDIIDRCG